MGCLSGRSDIITGNCAFYISFPDLDQRALIMNHLHWYRYEEEVLRNLKGDGTAAIIIHCYVQENTINPSEDGTKMHFKIDFSIFLYWYNMLLPETEARSILFDEKYRLKAMKMAIEEGVKSLSPEREQV